MLARDRAAAGLCATSLIPRLLRTPNKENLRSRADERH